MRYFSNMQPESEIVLVRTKAMLADFDNHRGSFEGLNYPTRTNILDLPFIEFVPMSRQSILEILDAERLSCITGQPVTAEHNLKYNCIVETASRWRESIDYQRPVVGSFDQKFPAIDQCLRNIKRDFFDGTAFDSVVIESSRGQKSIEFKFPAIIYGSMTAHIDIKLKYNGRMNFYVSSIYPKSGDIYVNAQDYYLTGSFHYAKFEISPGSEEQFHVASNSVESGISRIVKIAIAVASYYNPHMQPTETST